MSGSVVNSGSKLDGRQLGRNWWFISKTAQQRDIYTHIYIPLKADFKSIVGLKRRPGADHPVITDCNADMTYQPEGG